MSTQDWRQTCYRAIQAARRRLSGNERLAECVGVSRNTETELFVEFVLPTGVELGLVVSVSEVAA